MYILHSEPRYRAPLRTQAPAADKTLCPYCFAPGFHAPGPCKSCSVFGYHSEEPPLKRRIWTLKGRDYEPVDGPEEIETYDRDTEDQDEALELQKVV